MPVQINIRDMNAVLARLGPQVKQACIESAWAAVQYGERAIKYTINATDPPPVATKQYKRSWKARQTAEGGVLENKTKQAQWIEAGRAPGPAPLDPFLKWAKTKKIRMSASGEPMTVKQLAYLARAKVIRRGFRGRRVMARTVPKITKRLRKELRKRLKAMGLRAGRGAGRASFRISRD